MKLIDFGTLSLHLFTQRFILFVDPGTLFLVIRQLPVQILFVSPRRTTPRLARATAPFGIKLQQAVLLINLGLPLAARWCSADLIL